MVLPSLMAHWSRQKEGQLQCWAQVAASTMLRQLLKKATSSSAAARWSRQEGQLRCWTQVAANTMLQQLLRATLMCVSEQQVAVLALRSQVHRRVARHGAGPDPAAGQRKPLESLPKLPLPWGWAQHC